MRSLGILSIDVGGMRGIIPAMVIAEIERKMEKPASRIFSLMAGTGSTGAIIAASLCKGDNYGEPVFGADDVVKLCEKYRPNDFQPKPGVMSWLRRHKYYHDRLENVLDGYFGDSVLGDSLTKLLISNFDIKRDLPVVFSSWDKDLSGMKIKEALRTAITTAHTCSELSMKNHKSFKKPVKSGEFSPWLYTKDNQKDIFNVGFCHFGDGKYEKVHLMSISTGRTNFVSWLRPLIAILYRKDNNDSKRMPKLMVEKYYQIQKKLSVASMNPDDTSDENAENMRCEAQELIEDNLDVFTKFCTELQDK